MPGVWSLNMTSDAGDYIGQGRTWSHAPPGDQVRVSAGRQLISLHVDTADQTDGGWWDTDFAAPPGQNLAVGTYENARRYPFNDGAPGFDHGGMGRGCNTLTARFTIHELAYDPDGTLRTFRADFEQHCEGGTPPCGARGCSTRRDNRTSTGGRPRGRRPGDPGWSLHPATTSTTRAPRSRG